MGSFWPFFSFLPILVVFGHFGHFGFFRWFWSFSVILGQFGSCRGFLVSVGHSGNLGSFWTVLPFQVIGGVPLVLGGDSGHSALDLVLCRHFGQFASELVLCRRFGHSGNFRIAWDHLGSVWPFWPFWAILAIMSICVIHFLIVLMIPVIVGRSCHFGSFWVTCGIHTQAHHPAEDGTLDCKLHNQSKQWTGKLGLQSGKGSVTEPSCWIVQGTPFNVHY